MGDGKANTAAARETSGGGWVEIGKVGRPHGVRGELKVIAFNPGSEIWATGLEVSLRPKGKPPRPVVLRAMRETPRGLLVRIDGVEDREAAGELVHAVLAVPRERLPPLQDGEFYHVDVVGAEVFDEGTGARIGRVRELGSTNVDLLEIELDAGGTVTVPVLADYVVSIGREPGRVVVRDLDHWRS